MTNISHFAWESINSQSYLLIEDLKALEIREAVPSCKLSIFKDQTTNTQRMSPSFTYHLFKLMELPTSSHHHLSLSWLFKYHRHVTPPMSCTTLDSYGIHVTTSIEKPISTTSKKHTIYTNPNLFYFIVVNSHCSIDYRK